MVKFIFTNDKYRRARGGHVRLLSISCEKCNVTVCHYQKDGPGDLRRMYIDRIIDPAISISGKSLMCPNKHPLGVKIIYEKEHRLAFRLFVDAIKKKIIKAN
jgi:hypothetical protein